MERFINMRHTSMLIEPQVAQLRGAFLQPAPQPGADEINSHFTSWCELPTRTTLLGRATQLHFESVARSHNPRHTSIANQFNSRRRCGASCQSAPHNCAVLTDSFTDSIAYLQKQA